MWFDVGFCPFGPACRPNRESGVATVCAEPQTAPSRLRARTPGQLLLTAGTDAI